METNERNNNKFVQLTFSFFFHKRFFRTRHSANPGHSSIRLFLLTFAPLFLFSMFLRGQDEKDFSFNLEAKAHYGFIIPHRSGIKNLILGHVKAIEINYDIPTFGKKEWQQLYNYPTWGFSFYYSDLANPKQLGHAAGIYPYINFSQVKKNHFHLNFHIGWGIGYVSKAFDRTENYKNTVIGSKLNAIISLGSETEWKITKRASATIGFSFTHFSNGAFTVPNLGINIPTVNGGLSYYIGRTDKEFKRDSISRQKKRFEITWVAAGGIKAVYPLGSTAKYPAFSISTTFGSFRNRKSRLLPGIDLFYNTALFDYYKRAEISLGNKLEIIQTGVSLNYIATISRIKILTGMGVYIYSKYKFDGKFYHRIGMRYHINDHFFANVTLKTHFFKADFSEWGIGYSF